MLYFDLTINSLIHCFPVCVFPFLNIWIQHIYPCNNWLICLEGLKKLISNTVKISCEGIQIEKSKELIRGKIVIYSLLLLNYKQQNELQNARKMTNETRQLSI